MRVHVDECGHGQDPGGQSGVEDLADGVVEHVGGVQPHLRGLDVCGVAPAGLGVGADRLGLHELGDVQADGDEGHGEDVEHHAAGGRHRGVQVPGDAEQRSKIKLFFSFPFLPHLLSF